MIKPVDKNTLFYGDNLPILRDYIADESVDLIYLDPPFNSNRSYNVLFKDESGKDSESQITAFEDTWHWGSETEETYHFLIRYAPAQVTTMISSLRKFIGTNQMMAYLVMMTARLIELHRVLKPTGSIYLHCDPTASHYLKVVMDSIFDIRNFRNEVNWKRSAAHNDPTNRFGRITDSILFYSKSDANKFNKIYTGYSEEYLSAEWRKLPSGRYYKTENMLDPQGKMKEYDFMGTSARWRFTPDKIMELWNALQTEVPDSHGRIKLGRDGKPIKRGRIIFLDEMPGVPLQDIWDDINYIAGGASEALGYPTQKPLALLERIVMSSSNEGDVLLDPFCGCGTAIAAAQKLNRRWIGIDITHLSITLMKFRLKSSFSLVENKDYVVVGEPESIDGARQLAKDDRYQFQWWALSLIQAKPLGGEAGSKEGKKGSDKGIDGVISFINEKNQTERILIQVKSGHVKSGDVRDLRGVVEREDAAIGVFITLEEPSKDMITEAVSSGYYRSALWQQDYPRIQILTIKELLDDKTIHMPKSVPGQFKQAEKIKKQEGKQGELGI